MKAIVIPLLALICLAARPLEGQERLDVELRFGMNVNFYNIDKLKMKVQKFSGIRVFGTAILTGHIRRTFVTDYAMSVVIYNKSLGNSMNPLVSDVQIDFVNTAAVGVGWGGIESESGKWWKKAGEETFKGDGPRVGYVKYLRTMNQAPYYNLKHEFRNAFFLGSNFILNNHRRHQVCGSATATLGDFSMNYYNDGSVPFSTLSLADGFDRYWTGGGMLFAHNNHSFNWVELGFDQFTGYRPLTYELSNMLGMRVPEYGGHQLTGLSTLGGGGAKQQSVRDRNSSSTFNSSAYNLKIYFQRNYAADIGVIGSLFYKDRYYGIQDLIHLGSGMSMHPNRDINRFYLGLTYNQFGYAY